MPLNTLRVSLRLLATLVLLVAAGVAQAQQCWVQGGFGLNFGTVGQGGGTARGEIPIRCQASWNQRGFFRVCIYLGPGVQGTINPRRMTNYNGSYLEYDLYSDAAMQNLIGDLGSTPIYTLQAEVPAASTIELPAYVYGKVYPGQTVPAFAPYQETNIQGRLMYLTSTTHPPGGNNCMGGQTVSFGPANIDAEFQDECIVGTSDLDFGQVRALDAQVLATTAIRVECPGAQEWSLGLGPGQNAVAGSRRMAGPGGYISYELYQDAARTQAWGDIGPSDRYQGATTTTGDAVIVTVYGRVPPQAEISPGQYSDTVVATLYY